MSIQIGRRGGGTCRRKGVEVVGAATWPLEGLPMLPRGAWGDTISIKVRKISGVKGRLMVQWFAGYLVSLQGRRRVHPGDSRHPGD